MFCYVHYSMALAKGKCGVAQMRYNATCRLYICERKLVKDGNNQPIDQTRQKKRSGKKQIAPARQLSAKAWRLS